MRVVILTHEQQTAFENIVGKGEIACNKQFLLFPKCFQLNQITVSQLVHIFDIISLFAVELEESKIGISGKGLRKAEQELYQSITLPNDKFFNFTKLKEFADDNFKFLIFKSSPNG